MADERKTKHLGLNLSLDENYDYLDHRYKKLFDENWEIIDNEVFTPAAKLVMLEDVNDFFQEENVEAALAQVMTELRGHVGAGGNAHQLADDNSSGFMSSDDFKKLKSIAPNGINQETGDARYMKLAGSVMTGSLILKGDPTQSLEAATKQYVDGVRTGADAKFLQLAGGTMNGHILLTTADPTNERHAASKKYVDSVKAYADTIKTYADSIKQALDIKDSVKLATTANINLGANAPKLTIDGIQTQANDRILVKNQTRAADNGIYVVQDDGSFVRAIDADTNVKVTPGMFTFVEQGTANGDSGWVLSTDGSITLGTTSLTFVQFSGAGQVEAGTGLVKNGATLSLETTGAAPGTYTSVQVDNLGRVLSGSNPAVPATNVSFSSTNFTSTNVKAALDELFTNVSNGKIQLASAITDKGVQASGSDTFAILSSKISQISTGAGTAIAADVLAGKTFTNSTSNNLTGTMVNNGAVTITPASGSKQIPIGYHNGFGVVSGDSNLNAANIKSGVSIFNVAGTYTNESPGTAAAAADLLTGKAATVNGNRISGTMANNGALTITPGAVARPIPAGFHNGSGTVIGDANLSPWNIRAGTSIFGVVGSLAVGKQYSTNDINIVGGTEISITGLPFMPSLFMAFQSGTDADSNGMIIVFSEIGIVGGGGGCIAWQDGTGQRLADYPVVNWLGDGLTFTPGAAVLTNTPCTYFVFE